MARKTTKQPAELEQLHGRFEAWRATRQTRRIPEELWGDAVAAARKLGVHRTSRALRLNFDTLKRRVQEQASARAGARTEAFVDVTPVATPATVEGSADFQLSNGGAGPDFLGVDLDPVNGPGFTAGVVYSFGIGTIVFRIDGDPVFELTFQLDSATLVGNDVGATVDLTFSESLGLVPVANEVVTGAGSMPALVQDGALTLHPAVFFERGDVNTDGSLTIVDPILALQFLSQGGGVPPCQDTVDFNDDATMDLDDVIASLNYLFLGGPSSAPPGPGFCGPDTTADMRPDCVYPEASCD